MALRDWLRRSRGPAPTVQRHTTVNWPAGGYQPNWFQKSGIPPDPTAAMAVSAVYACVAVISQELARIPLHHIKESRTGAGSTRLYDTPAARVLARPNHYQTQSDFVLNLAASVLLEGNGVAPAQRDGARRISSSRACERTHRSNGSTPG